MISTCDKLYCELNVTGYRPDSASGFSLEYIAEAFDISLFINRLLSLSMLYSIKVLKRLSVLIVIMYLKHIVGCITNDAVEYLLLDDKLYSNTIKCLAFQIVGN